MRMKLLLFGRTDAEQATSTLPEATPSGGCFFGYVQLCLLSNLAASCHSCSRSIGMLSARMKSKLGGIIELVQIYRVTNEKGLALCSLPPCVSG